MDPLYLAVALNATGWHPASWREPDARPADLLAPSYWVDLVTEAERGAVDFVTFEDALTLQPDGVQGRLDAVLTAARVAPTHPPDRSAADRRRHPHRALSPVEGDRDARLRQRGTGRGARPGGARRRRSAPLRQTTDAHLDRVSSTTKPPTTSRCCAGCGTAGRTTPRSATPPPGGSSTETSCTTSTSKESGSRSRVPRSRRGRRRDSPWSPRPRHGADSRPFIAGSADIGFVTPPRTRRRDRRSPIGKRRTVRFVDVVVFLDDTPDRAEARRRRLDDLARRRVHQRCTRFRGHCDPAGRRAAGLAVVGRARFPTAPRKPAARPAADQLDGLTPELQRRGLFRTPGPGPRCARRSALPRPANRYATA